MNGSVYFMHTRCLSALCSAQPLHTRCATSADGTLVALVEYTPGGLRAAAAHFGAENLLQPANSPDINA